MIRAWRAGVVASFALPLAISAQRPTDFKPTLLQTDSIRIAAQLTNDLATLDKLLGNDLRFGHTNARIDGKNAYMDDLRTGAHKYKSLTTEGVTAREYGSAGVVTGTANVSTEYHGVAPNSTRCAIRPRTPGAPIVGCWLRISRSGSHDLSS